MIQRGRPRLSRVLLMAFACYLGAAVIGFAALFLIESVTGIHDGWLGIAVGGVSVTIAAIVWSGYAWRQWR